MTFCSFSIIHKTKQENYFYESNKQLTLFEVAFDFKWLFCTSNENT